MKDGDPALVKALTQAIRETFQSLRATHPENRFYAFGLYVTRDALFIGPTAASDRGLQESIQNRGGDEGKLRWALAQSPHHLEGEECFEKVQQLLAGRPDPYDLDDDEFTREVELRMESCFAALSALDEEGVFGAGEERSAMVLNVFGADESDRVRLEHAERLNPAEALARLTPELSIREPTGDPVLLGSMPAFQVGGLDFREGLLAAACTDGELFAWRFTGDDEPEELLAVRDEDEHWSVLIDGSGGILYGSTGGIRRRTVDRPDEPEIILAHEAKVTQLVRAPDGSKLIADEGYEHLVALDAERNVLWEREPGGRPLAFSPDGSSIAAAGQNGQCVSLLDPSTGSERAIVACGGTTAAAFGPDGGTLAVGNREGVAVHSKGEGWEAVSHWSVDSTVNALAFSPSGARLAGAFDDGTLRVWDVATGEPIATVNGRQEALLALVWIDESRIAAGGRDVDRGHPVYLWRVS